MKIQGRKNTPMGPLGPISVPVTQEAMAPAEVGAAELGDRVDLGSTQELKQLHAAVQAMPSVRTGRVADLRGAIEEGSYHVESDKLARKVVDEVLSEALLQQARSRAR